jgi:prepilin-type N-terminal cleavage/methylation domain-containing protein
MPTSSVGAIDKGKDRQRGVTLIEMMIVVMLMALLAGLSYPSVASGVDSLRLRSASDSIVAFLNTALDRADRRQQAVEISISPRESLLTARSADLGFVRRLDLPEGVHIASIRPAAEIAPDEARRFLVYPGGTVPRIGIELANNSGRRRMVSIDPITGVPRSDVEP